MCTIWGMNGNMKGSISYSGAEYWWYGVTYVAGNNPFLFPISPFHQCSSERSVTVMTSPRRNSNSPVSCGIKSYNACTKV
uniref:Uncharacterized protein n=1 Tax=Megaselia scalaris TaxID=36166 RepID=T1GA62_MEGSC